MLDPLPVPAYLWEPIIERLLGSNKAFCDLVFYSQDEILELNWRDLVVADEIPTAGRAIEVGPTMTAVRWHWRRRDRQMISVTLASRLTKFVDDDGEIHDVYVALVINTGEDKAIPAAVAFR